MWGFMWDLFKNFVFGSIGFERQNIYEMLFNIKISDIYKWDLLKNSNIKCSIVDAINE